MGTTRLLALQRRALYGVVLLGLLLLTLNSSSQSIVRAQGAGFETPEVIEYFTSNTITLADGTSLEQDIINGPPNPPPGYKMERAVVELPTPNEMKIVNTLTVPAYDWVFGCSAVSGAMIAGYYDRLGFSNIYTGPTDGGVMPLDNSGWPNWWDGFVTYPNLPLAASHNGVDGRVIKGSIDDYWMQYGSVAPDPFIGGGWAEHTWGDAIGDYMKTSQSTYGNSDGSTTFWTYNASPVPLTCADMVTFGISQTDGTYGRKLFYEARGYTVTDCYNQKTDNQISGGFSYVQYKAEIDAGRPVMLNLYGHTVVGVGYDDTAGNLVYLHDTWDYNNHIMTWGGQYAGMDLISVSIVNLAAPAGFSKSTPTDAASNQSLSPTLTWGASAGADSYEYCYDITDNDTCDGDAWVDNGASTSKALSGLDPLTTYYWHVRALNPSGTTYSNGAVTAFWSFTTAGNPPDAFNKSSPANGAVDQPTSPTLTWGASAGADRYEYCYDTTNDNTCDGDAWVDNGASTSKALSGLTEGETYYWQVRAVNTGGTTEADSGNWWSFTIIPNPPSAFNKSSPANGAVDQPTSLTLTWGASTGADSYEYCYDTTDNDSCDGDAWVDNGASTSKALSGLTKGETYYWQVRAVNTGGTTEADSGTWWSFTTNRPVVELLTNGGFNLYDSRRSKIPTGWAASGFVSGDGKSTVREEGAYSVKMKGGRRLTTKTLTQEILVNGDAGDAFIFSIGMKGTKIPVGGTCRAEVALYNGATFVNSVWIDCPIGTFGWTNPSVNLTAGGVYTKAVVTLTFVESKGFVWFDKASLLK